MSNIKEQTKSELAALPPGHYTIINPKQPCLDALYELGYLKEKCLEEPNKLTAIKFLVKDNTGGGGDV